MTRIQVPALVSQVKLCLLQTEGHPRGLGHHFHINALVGLDPDDQLVTDSSTIENVSRHVFVLDTALQRDHVTFSLASLV